MIYDLCDRFALNQIIVHSTSQHSTTCSSDRKIVKPHLCEAGLRAHHGALHNISDHQLIVLSLLYKRPPDNIQQKVLLDFTVIQSAKKYHIVVPLTSTLDHHSAERSFHRCLNSVSLLLIPSLSSPAPQKRPPTDCSGAFCLYPQRHSLPGAGGSCLVPAVVSTTNKTLSMAKRPAILPHSFRFRRPTIYRGREN